MDMLVKEVESLRQLNIDLELKVREIAIFHMHKSPNGNCADGYWCISRYSK